MIDAAELKRLAEAYEEEVRTNVYVDARHELENYMTCHASELLALVEADGWRTIESAPKNCDVLTRGRFGPTADEHESEVQTCIAECVDATYGKERYKTWRVKPCSPMRSGSWRPTHWRPLPKEPAQ